MPDLRTLLADLAMMMLGEKGVEVKEGLVR